MTFIVSQMFTGRLVDFTLSNARRFYSSKGDPLGVEGLKVKNLSKCFPMSAVSTSYAYTDQHVIPFYKFNVRKSISV